MGTNHNEHDEALAKILAALRDAAPPEGMEARIAQRLQRATSVQPVNSRWRYLFAGCTLATEWARGAIAGAAATLLATAVVLFTGHLLRAHNDHSQIASQMVSLPHAVPAVNDQMKRSPAQTVSIPCDRSSLLLTRNVASAHHAEMLLVASATTAPSHPAPPLGLTAQERELVRLIQTADPKQLAALDAEAEAKSQSDDATQFEKFFAQPAYTQPISPAPEHNE